ncbi:sigma factor [Aquimarina sediminis]|uniref:sigma factor n=1 Tax=Aquimarina sediminis TaxID=2070536 RepID=UPI000CA01585|nr:sigma factor [Aquimarina sediminis]
MKFEEIWKENKNPLLNFIKTKLNDKSMADDILQEIGIKLYHNLNQKNDIKNYRTWLFQVTRNTIADHYRKNKKVYQPFKHAPGTSENSNVCVCDLSGFIIQKYLPEKYGKPLYLSDIEKKSQNEISKILDLSVTATKTRIQRARKKLKNLITDCVDISYNNKNQIIDYQIKDNCELPQELIDQIEKINLVL